MHRYRARVKSSGESTAARTDAQAADYRAGIGMGSFTPLDVAGLMIHPSIVVMAFQERLVKVR